MSSVTQIVKSIKQPYGGYLRASKLRSDVFNDGNLLHERENLDASIVGMAVDYLVRYLMGADADDAFAVSIEGAKMRDKFLSRIYGDVCHATMDCVNHHLYWFRKGVCSQTYFEAYCSLDDDSGDFWESIIYSACQLVRYDVWCRNIMAAVEVEYKYTQKMLDENFTTYPDALTVHNIRIMVERGLTFFKKCGPLVKDGFTFGPGGYTDKVDAGDGDFLTFDTLWDFKVSKSNPTSKHTMQLLMYYIMGKHSGQCVFDNIDKIGVFNPRLNTAYVFDMKDMNLDVLLDVEQNVIGFDKSVF